MSENEVLTEFAEYLGDLKNLTSELKEKLAYVETDVSALEQRFEKIEKLLNAKLIDLLEGC